MSVCPVSSPQKSEPTPTTHMNINENEETLAVWDCGSPLYDSYELVSLTHLIERHLMALPTIGGSKRLVTTDTTKFYYPYDHGPVDSDHTSRGSSCSSIVGTLSGFVVIKKLLKKKEKKRVVGQRKDKRKSLKIGVSGFSDGFGCWKNYNCFFE